MIDDEKYLRIAKEYGVPALSQSKAIVFAEKIGLVKPESSINEMALRIGFIKSVTVPKGIYVRTILIEDVGEFKISLTWNEFRDYMKGKYNNESKSTPDAIRYEDDMLKHEMEKYLINMFKISL